MSRLKAIRHVRQEDQNGCIVACFAMVAGKTYAEVVSSYPYVREERGGLTMWDWLQFFALNGFGTQAVWAYDRVTKQDRAGWPWTPWADAHFCCVDGGCGGAESHGVVLLRDGTVFDPARDEPRRWGDYPKVGVMCALFDLGIRPTTLRAPPFGWVPGEIAEGA